MKEVNIIPTGWPCKLSDCPPGIFYRESTKALGFKTEYRDDESGEIEVYCLPSGEIFWGGVTTPGERQDLIVQPCEVESHEI
jgi:hypothetical protein